MGAGEDVPELVPARMVNEFVYCPRLFFLEWVQARFVDNPDTVDGRYQHRVVDAETGRAPGPAQAADLKGARSLLISAPKLGLIGRLDCWRAMTASSRRSTTSEVARRLAGCGSPNGASWRCRR